jgi:hypothetical protein
MESKEFAQRRSRARGRISSWKMVKRRRMAGQTPRGRGVTCLSLDEQGEERSAALPSGLGTAALLGVLASYLADTLRNYWWRAFFGADPPRNLGSGFRANLSGSWFLVHATCPLFDAGHWIQIPNTLVLNAGRLPNNIGANSAFSSLSEGRRKDSLPQRGKLCLRGTRRLQPTCDAKASPVVRARV